MDNQIIAHLVLLVYTFPELEQVCYNNRTRILTGLGIPDPCSALRCQPRSTGILITQLDITFGQRTKKWPQVEEAWGLNKGGINFRPCRNIVPPGQVTGQS